MDFEQAVEYVDDKFARGGFETEEEDAAIRALLARLEELEREKEGIGNNLIAQEQITLLRNKDYLQERTRAEAAEAKFAEAQAQLARAVKAGKLLNADIRRLQPDEPHERMIPTQHRVSDIRQFRSALAAAEPEVEEGSR